MTREALEMVCSTKCSDELPSKMCTAFTTHALLFHSAARPPAATSWPFCQLLLAVRFRQSPRCFWLHGCISYLGVSCILLPVRLELARSRGIVVVECTIGRGHWPVLRWETHPKKPSGPPARNAMSALLYCCPLAVGEDTHSNAFVLMVSMGATVVVCLVAVM